MLVNNSQKVAVFSMRISLAVVRYLPDFSGNAELKSIMSDGYNAYVFIGDELKSAQFKDIVYQVCMSQVNNKFVKSVTENLKAEYAYKLNAVTLEDFVDAMIQYLPEYYAQVYERFRGRYLEFEKVNLNL